MLNILTAYMLFLLLTTTRLFSLIFQYVTCLKLLNYHALTAYLLYCMHIHMTSPHFTVTR